MDESPFGGILVGLDIGGRQSLFIMVCSDGSINRLGTGAENNSENEMYMGKVGPELFGCLAAKITPQLLQWFGRGIAADPAPKGKLCKLKVGLKREDGKETWSYWQYGTQSLGPPPEIREFVIAAVDATDSWYQNFKRNSS